VLTLKVEKDWLTVLQVSMVEGVMCAVTTCADYDAYKALPEVISYNGAKLGRTGWNSDTGHAFYQSNALVVRKVG
jgi:hypothetical protein